MKFAEVSVQGIVVLKSWRETGYLDGVLYSDEDLTLDGGQIQELGQIYWRILTGKKGLMVLEKRRFDNLIGFSKQKMKS
jgi:hypothetical protein